MLLDTPLLSTLAAMLVLIGIGYTVGSILDYYTAKVRQANAAKAQQDCEIEDSPALARESF